MKIITKELQIKNEKFTLTNQRVLFWEKHQLLILSDLHIGKTAHFRKNGIPIPKNILQKDLEKLEKLIFYFSAKQVLINGDLLHAGDNSDVDYFCDWKAQFSDVKFHLVEGNHDKISKNLQEKLCLHSVQNILEKDDFCLIHEFNPQISTFQITGHIHPGISIKSAVKSFRLPCFMLTENQLLLPAFSEFTGLDTKNISKKAHFFAFTENEIYEL